MRKSLNLFTNIRAADFSLFLNKSSLLLVCFKTFRNPHFSIFRLFDLQEKLIKWYPILLIAVNGGHKYFISVAVTLVAFGEIQSF